MSVLVVLVSLLGTTFASSAGAATSRAELTFTEPDKLALALPSDDYKTVWLRSDGAEGDDVTWELLVDKGKERPEVLREAANTGKPVLAVQGTTGIARDTVARYRVRVHGLSSDGVKGAQLVARVAGAAPAALDVSIAHKADLSPTLDAVLLVPLVAALVVMLIRGLTLPERFCGPVGTLDLDYTKSFATTLTAIGALLGTILSAGLIDEETSGISKAGFQGLNLTFGVLILIAPLAYMLVQKKITTQEGSPPKAVEHYQGATWALLLAGTITLWAVLGEIVTIYLLLGQLDAAGEVSSVAITIMQLALAVGAVLAIAYSWRKLRWIVETAAGGLAPGLAGGFLPVGAPPATLPSWTPL